MASRDLFQSHLLWVFAFTSDSLVRMLKVLNAWTAELRIWGWISRPLNLLGNIRIGIECSSSWLFPLDSFPPTCSSVRGITTSSVPFLCVGERRPASAVSLMTRYWVLKLPPIVNYSTDCNKRIRSLVSLCNLNFQQLWILYIQIWAHLLCKTTCHLHRPCCSNRFWFFSYIAVLRRISKMFLFGAWHCAISAFVAD